MIPEAAQRAAEAAYTEKLVELRLAEGGGFKVASQQRRAIAFALEAAAPHMLASAWDAGFQKGVEFCDWNDGIDSYKPDFTNPHGGTK